MNNQAKQIEAITITTSMYVSKTVAKSLVLEVLSEDVPANPVEKIVDMMVTGTQMAWIVGLAVGLRVSMHDLSLASRVSAALDAEVLGEGRRVADLTHDYLDALRAVIEEDRNATRHN